jgi:hypothetical protein
MKRSSSCTRRKVLEFERCEDRTCTTLVFVLNGNALSAVGPNAVTANAAQVLAGAGQRAIQLTTPTMGTPAAFYRVVRQIESRSQGQSIGLVCFSAGGILAARLAGVAALHVTAALDCYGPPDLQDWLTAHRGDVFYGYVTRHVRLTPPLIQLLSGRSNTSAYVVCAFGLHDRNVTVPVSTASFQADFRNGRVYDYPGPHDVSINASRAAVSDFLRTGQRPCVLRSFSAESPSRYPGSGRGRLGR